MIKFKLAKNNDSVPIATNSYLQNIGVTTDRIVDGFLGGSRITCSPPPKDTDCDIFLLVRNIGQFENDQSLDWESNITDYEGETETFKTYRKGEYNLLVFDDPTEYGAIKGATALAKKLNIQDKEQRYRLFETVRSPWR